MRKDDVGRWLGVVFILGLLAFIFKCVFEYTFPYDVFG